MKYESDIVNTGHVKQLGNIWVYIFSYIYRFIKLCIIKITSYLIRLCVFQTKQYLLQNAII